MSPSKRIPLAASASPSTSSGPVAAWAIGARLQPAALLAKLRSALPSTHRWGSQLRGGFQLGQRQEAARLALRQGRTRLRKARLAKPKPTRKLSKGVGNRPGAVRYQELELCRRVLWSCWQGPGAYASFVNQAIMALPRRPDDTPMHGISSDFLFDTFTDHLRDLLLERGLVWSPSRIPGRFMATRKLQALMRPHRMVRRRFEAVLIILVREALRRSFLAYAAPVATLATSQLLGAEEAS